jgi:hypothetical protein
MQNKVFVKNYDEKLLQAFPRVRGIKKQLRRLNFRVPSTEIQFHCRPIEEEVSSFTQAASEQPLSYHEAPVFPGVALELSRKAQSIATLPRVRRVIIERSL